MIWSCSDLPCCLRRWWAMAPPAPASWRAPASPPPPRLTFASDSTWRYAPAQQWTQEKRRRQRRLGLVVCGTKGAIKEERVLLYIKEKEATYRNMNNWTFFLPDWQACSSSTGRTFQTWRWPAWGRTPWSGTCTRRRRCRSAHCQNWRRQQFDPWRRPLAPPASSRRRPRRSCRGCAAGAAAPEAAACESPWFLTFCCCSRRSPKRVSPHLTWRDKKEHKLFRS